MREQVNTLLYDFDAFQNFRKCIKACVTALTLAHGWQLQHWGYNDVILILVPFLLLPQTLLLELNKNVFMSSSKAQGSILKEPNLSILFHPHMWKNAFNFCAPAWLKAIAWNFNSGDFHSQAGGQSWNCSTFLSTSFCCGDSGKE